MKNELKKLQRSLSEPYQECSGSQCKVEEVMDDEEEENRNNKEAFLKITLGFMRRMKQDELADALQTSKRLLMDVAGEEMV